MSSNAFEARPNRDVDLLEALLGQIGVGELLVFDALLNVLIVEIELLDRVVRAEALLSVVSAVRTVVALVVSAVCLSAQTPQPLSGSLRDRESRADGRT